MNVKVAIIIFALLAQCTLAGPIGVGIIYAGKLLRLLLKKLKSQSQSVENINDF